LRNFSFHARFCATFTLFKPSETRKEKRSSEETIKNKEGCKMPATVKSRKNEYRDLLLKKRQELLAGTRAGTEALSAVQSPDEMEFAVQSVQQDVNVTAASVRSRMLRQIDYALERFAGGTYGECQSCGEEISPARLKAIPWAEYCLKCEELRSRN
jgi:DnaK suppressor protein